MEVSTINGELVDDRELRSIEHDKFGHADVARELADLVCAVELPANIALYGPWGSGKSGLAYMLDEELRKREADTRFVRFDAFKYAEHPLRRHFVSQLAKELKVKDDEFGKDLYSSRNGWTSSSPSPLFAKS